MNVLQRNYLAKANREQIIKWLCEFDRNGCYTDTQRIAEGFDPLTKETALDKAFNQLSEVGW